MWFETEHSVINSKQVLAFGWSDTAAKGTAVWVARREVENELTVIQIDEKDKADFKECFVSLLADRSDQEVINITDTWCLHKSTLKAGNKAEK